MKLLVIEDDRATNDYIADGFRREGHSVDQVMTGQDGLVQASVGSYDVVILDRMLPGLDGIAVLKTLRGAKNKTAVILLTAVDSVDDRIEGLRLRRAFGPRRSPCAPSADVGRAHRPARPRPGA